MQASSLLSTVTAVTGKRDIKKVPFVELYNGCLQGVVSSGSDVRRVYVSFFEVQTLNFYCSTNNNRPCGGVRGAPCNHLRTMLKEAIAQYGLEQVVRFLKIVDDPTQIKNEREILAHKGQVLRDPANEVFSRFLNYLSYLELEASGEPLPTMNWFV